MLFFPSPDGLNRTDIRWNDFVEMLATKKSRVAAFVMNYGGTAKTIDDFPEQAARMERMAEVYEKCSRRAVRRKEDDEEGEELDDGESKADKAKGIKRTLMKEIAGSYRRIVIDFEADEWLMRALDFSENMTKAEKKLIEGYISTYEEIKKNNRLE